MKAKILPDFQICISVPLRISSVNVIKFADSDLVTFTEDILKGKRHFCAVTVSFTIETMKSVTA